MFRAHAGFLGVLFSRSSERGEHAVISFWDGLASVGELEASPLYQSIVRRIEETSFLVGKSSVEVLEVEAGTVATGLANVLP